MAKTCPSCGAQNRDMARFCQSCRQALEMVCPSCGMINGSRANFCSGCGASLQVGSQPLAAVSPAASMPATFSGLLPGTVLDGRYCIEKRLGGGGMGAVYLALDQRLGTRWAVKEMSDAALTDPAERRHAVQAFENEARLLAALDHYNLPKVNNHFQENGKYYLVMDFIDGLTLDAMIEERLRAAIPGQPAQPFSEAQVLRWAEELCAVLSYLHNQNPPVIFRDLKPGNIIVEKSGRLRLIDFGVARLFKTGQSKDTASFGTRGFAPPEQYGKDQTDPRSDIYALGATLHFLLTLRDPADDPFHFPPAWSLNDSVSMATSSAVARAVSFERAERWATVGAFLNALKDGALPAAGIPAAPAPTRLPLRRSVPASAGAVANSTASVAIPALRAGSKPAPMKAAAANGATSEAPAQGVRRSSLPGYLFWISLCSFVGYMLISASAQSLGVSPDALVITPGPYSPYAGDLFARGLVVTVLVSFPQVIALLRTRLPMAFTLPLLLLEFIFLDDIAYLGPIFAGVVLAEFLLLIQLYNPNSFWRLFLVTVVAHGAVNFFVNSSLYDAGLYLGIVVGSAVACVIGRFIAVIFQWDS